MTTRIISVANQKGGTGKTTTAINLAAGLARGVNKGKRVLLIDADPQANATAVFLGVSFAAGPRQPGTHTLYEVLMAKVKAADAIRSVTLAANEPVPSAEMDVLPAHLELASAELELVTEFERERKLQQALFPIVDDYAFIVIDCPPSLGLLTVNALMASTEVLIPVDAGFFPLIGLGLLRRTIDMVRGANSGLKIVGVTATMMDHTALASDTYRELTEAFGDLVLPMIPRRVAIGEAHAAGADVFAYDSRNEGTKAYAALLEEVLKRG